MVWLAALCNVPRDTRVHTRKFQLVNWVPTKFGACPSHPRSLSPIRSAGAKATCADIPITFPEGDELIFNWQHLDRDLQPGKTELQDDAPSGEPPCPGCVDSARSDAVIRTLIQRFKMMSP